MTLVIGVDGGGTHTRAVLFDEALREHARVEGPGSNPAALGWEGAMQVMRHLIRQVMTEAARSTRDIAAIGIGQAGLTTAGDTDRLSHLLALDFPGAIIVARWDLEAALIGAHGRRAGMMLEAGTGSGACGISATGQLVRIGGWGYLIGDEGSGYALGCAALRAVMRAHDGRDSQTGLTDRILAALALPDPVALVAWLYGQPIQPRRIAALAPIVSEAASAGDPVAGRIVDQAVDDLIGMVTATLRAMRLETAPLALLGGLLAAPDSHLGTRFRQTIGQRLPRIPVVEPKYPSVAGAALMALAALEDRQKEE